VNKKNVSVCHARSNRQTHVYLSTANTLQLTTTNDRRRGNFLLRVEGKKDSEVLHTQNLAAYLLSAAVNWT